MAQIGSRDVAPIVTEYNGVRYRSRTEARWAIFFEVAGLQFSYEPTRIELSTGEDYLPDFYLGDFEAYFEVKGENDEIVVEEARKARQLSFDRAGRRVWLAIGPPSAETPNILLLEKWGRADPIEAILARTENRYQFLEDRRDERVYWLQANAVTGEFETSLCLGGPGASTDHTRLPLLHRHVAQAYDAAKAARW